MKQSFLLSFMVIFILAGCSDSEELDAIRRRNAELLAKVYSYSDEIRNLRSQVEYLQADRSENFCNVESHIGIFSEELNQDSFLVYPPPERYGGLNQQPMGFTTLTGYSKSLLTEYHDGDYTWEEETEYFVLLDGNDKLFEFYEKVLEDEYRAQFGGRIAFALSREDLPAEDWSQLDKSSPT